MDSLRSVTILQRLKFGKGQPALEGRTVTYRNPTPKAGFVFRRYRKVRGGRILDAHDYGYKAWAIPISR